MPPGFFGHSIKESFVRAMKNKISTIFLIVVLLTGLFLLLYPTVSNYWNSMHSSQAVAEYDKNIRDLNEETYQKLLSDAVQYNNELYVNGVGFSLPQELKKTYSELLNIGGNGIMGYIEIPSINVQLPIYHGTDDSVLQIAVGHLDWSSLPVGGENTHCILSGHRGLPSAKLFTNLDKLAVGDTFVIRVLNEVLTYEVDKILIVEPHEVDSLVPEAGRDLCTLTTCTPYGINSHRLLVRGHRIETVDNSSARVVSDAVRIEPLVIAPIAAVPLLAIPVIVVFAFGSKKKKHGRGDSIEK